MGYYIETDQAFNKSADIRQMMPSTISLPKPPVWSAIPEGKAVVCVVHNTFFEAAAYCYSEAELNAFINDGTTRKKEWLLVPKDWAEKESGFPR